MADHGTAYAASRRHPAAASAARRQSERPQTFMVPIACRPYTLRRQWAQTSLLADGVREDRGMILVLPASPRRRGEGRRRGSDAASSDEGAVDDEWGLLQCHATGSGRPLDRCVRLWTAR